MRRDGRVVTHGVIAHLWVSPASAPATIHGISGGAKFSEVVAGSVPYVFLMPGVIAMLWFWPEIALWLPTTMRGK